jgi:ketosteroid isomerase-like protein
VLLHGVAARQGIPLDAIRRPRDTPIWKLEAALKCRSCPRPAAGKLRSQTQHHARSSTGLKRAPDKKECDCKTTFITRTMEETMDIDRRKLALPTLALALLSVVPMSVVPAFGASADEDAVAKNVEAFRAAQFAADAKALDALCAAELSYSHSDGKLEDKATFIANATSGKSKFLSLEYKDTNIRVVGPAAVVRFHWVGESEAVADGKKSATNLHILMNWQKQGADWKLLSRAATKL